MTIKDLVEQAHANSRAKGWWDGINDPAATVPEKIALIHSEVSEALEDWRNGKMEARYLHRTEGTDWDHDSAFPCTACDYQTPKTSGFPSELADIVIRVADLTGALGIDLEKAIAEKMAYNATRPHRHGGKRA